MAVRRLSDRLRSGALWQQRVRNRTHGIDAGGWYPEARRCAILGDGEASGRRPCRARTLLSSPLDDAKVTLNEAVRDVGEAMVPIRILLTKTFADEVGFAIHEMAARPDFLPVLPSASLQAVSLSANHPVVVHGRRLAMPGLRRLQHIIGTSLLALVAFGFRFVNAMTRVYAVQLFSKADVEIIEPIQLAMFPGPDNPMMKAVGLATDFAFLFLFGVLLFDMILCFVDLDLATLVLPKVRRTP